MPENQGRQDWSPKWILKREHDQLTQHDDGEYFDSKTTEFMLILVDQPRELGFATLMESEADKVPFLQDCVWSDYTNDVWQELHHCVKATVRQVEKAKRIWSEQAQAVEDWKS